MIKPKNAMRALYWTRIQVQSNIRPAGKLTSEYFLKWERYLSTIFFLGPETVNLWDELEEPPIEIDELETLFSVPPTQKREPKKAPTESAKPSKFIPFLFENKDKDYSTKISVLLTSGFTFIKMYFNLSS